MPALALAEQSALVAGMFAQGGVFVVPGHLELYGRYDVYAQDIRHTGADGLQRYQAGLGGDFFGTALEVRARYSYDDRRGKALAVAPPLGVSPPPEGHGADVQFVLTL